jgi:hypothetical protein
VSGKKERKFALQCMLVLRHAADFDTESHAFAVVPQKVAYRRRIYQIRRRNDLPQQIAVGRVVAERYPLEIAKPQLPVFLIADTKYVAGSDVYHPDDFATKLHDVRNVVDVSSELIHKVCALGEWFQHIWQERIIKDARRHVKRQDDVILNFTVLVIFHIHQDASKHHHDFRLHVAHAGSRVTRFAYPLTTVSSLRTAPRVAKE